MGLEAGLPWKEGCHGLQRRAGVRTEVTKVTAHEHDAKLLNAFCYSRFQEKVCGLKSLVLSIEKKKHFMISKT